VLRRCRHDGLNSLQVLCVDYAWKAEHLTLVSLKMASFRFTGCVGFLSNASTVGSFLSSEPSSQRKPVVAPFSKRWCISRHRQAAKINVNASAGQGFRIKNKASDIAWAEEYKAYLRKSGEGICRMAMEGYNKVGCCLSCALNLSVSLSNFPLLSPGAAKI
jgi:hypothetical protein